MKTTELKKIRKNKKVLAVGYKAIKYDLSTNGASKFRYGNKDENIIGKIFTVDEEIKECFWGLHFSKDPANVFNFYEPLGYNRYFKVEDLQADYGTQAQIERDMLRKENQELKKQLKATEEVAEEHMKKWVTMEAQQKEFIKYLEEEIEHLEHSRYVSFNEFGERKLYFYKQILSKYKEIIGSDKE